MCRIPCTARCWPSRGVSLSPHPDRRRSRARRWCTPGPRSPGGLRRRASADSGRLARGSASGDAACTGHTTAILQAAWGGGSTAGESAATWCGRRIRWLSSPPATMSLAIDLPAAATPFSTPTALLRNVMVSATAVAGTRPARSVSSTPSANRWNVLPNVGTHRVLRFQELDVVEDLVGRSSDMVRRWRTTRSRSNGFTTGSGDSGRTAFVVSPARTRRPRNLSGERAGAKCRTVVDPGRVGRSGCACRHSALGGAP